MKVEKRQLFVRDRIRIGSILPSGVENEGHTWIDPELQIELAAEKRMTARRLGVEYGKAGEPLEARDLLCRSTE